VEEVVKTRFPRRQERARATRRAILAAARHLFVTDGYGATSLQAIADTAGVAVQTVYAVFRNKRSILAEVLDVAIAGDDQQVVVNAREWMQPVWTAPTPADRLRAYAAAVRRIMDGAGDVFAVVAAAAASDPDLVDLAYTAEQRRRAGAGAVIESVRSIGALRPGLAPEHAVDVLWLLNSPTVFAHLVRQAGWTLDEYQDWLAEAMIRELLDPSPSSKRPDQRDT
jgi:AcrR family transcriptional regulator